MKKIAYILGAAVLAAGSFTAVASFADATVSGPLASSLVSSAQSAEAQSRAGGTTADTAIVAAIEAAIESQIETAVANGDSSGDIQAAMTKAQNTSGLSADVAQAFGVVEGQLATLEQSKPGGVSAGTANGGGSVAPPAPPPPAAAGTGYVTQ